MPFPFPFPKNDSFSSTDHSSAAERVSETEE